MLRWILGLSFGVSCIACDSNVPKGPQVLCDGSSNVTLKVALGGGFVGELYEFMYPLGDTYLVVTGECRAWLSIDGWSDLRSLELSEDEAESIATTFNFRDLSNLAGSYRTANCFDAMTSSISSREAEVACYCECKSGDTPSEVRRADGEARAKIAELWEAATPVNGALQIAVIQNAALEERDVFNWQEWPLSQDIGTFLESEIPDADGGTLLEAGQDAAALRQLRDGYLRLGGRLNDDELIPVDPRDGEVYGLLIRDALPSALVGLSHLGSPGDG